MRQDYSKFRQQGVEIVAIAPDGPRALVRYWEQEGIPFPGVPDPEHRIAERFGQEVKLTRLGRLPAVIVVDAESIVRAAWYGESMRDIPGNDELLVALCSLAQ
ncbi:redoxin domain-containing protein [Thermomicrobium sp. CFH 73360]|nr:redoxin domain-containing protein [Thermomicrobium sp. CFH 73360]